MNPVPHATVLPADWRTHPVGVRVGDCVVVYGLPGAPREFHTSPDWRVDGEHAEERAKIVRKVVHLIAQEISAAALTVRVEAAR